MVPTEKGRWKKNSEISESNAPPKCEKGEGPSGEGQSPRVEKDEDPCEEG